MDDLTLRLSQTDVFKQLPERERSHLAKMAVRHKLEPGDFLVYQGDQWSKLLLIGSGALKWLLLSESGKEYVFFTLESGSLFWGHTIFDDQPMPASLAATKPTEVYTWAKELIQPVLYRYPEAMWEIGKSLASIMRRNREVVINLAFRHVAGRLAKLLLDISSEDTKQIERDFTLNDLATMVASSPEVVCRILYDLQDKEMLEITRTQIVLHDRHSLSNLVEEA
ncbi:MAG: Crp/Fnr family transcriptional regulator [Chloroflexota bacterium]|nr:Crp/Fnr family transcriptional regulator [Chloroflexota bacterium]